MGVRVVWAAVVTATAAAMMLTSCAGEPRPTVSIHISKAQWQYAIEHESWPFTVDEGVLTCRAPDWVTFTANGTEYALSDNARWVGHYPSVSPTLIEGSVDIGNERYPVPTRFDAVIARGRKLCR